MILVAIIVGPWLTEIKREGIFVVNNTVDVSYVVPIGVVVHGQLKTKREYLQCENIPPEPPELRRMSVTIENILLGRMQQPPPSLDALEREIGRLEDMYRIDRTTTAELRQISAVLGVTAGQWYKCSKGHLYVIGECGEAMQKSMCPDCGESVGGAHHTLVGTSRQAELGL